MEIRNTAKERVAELIESRDLRYYGTTHWSLQDSFKEAEIIEATTPVSMIDTLRDLYRIALQNMSEQDASNMVFKLKRCPPRPSGV